LVADRAVIAALGADGALAAPESAHELRDSWRAYAALALGTVLFVFTIWYEVYRDTRPDAAAWRDAVLQSHRQWRLRTSFLFLIWSILAGFCAPFGFASVVFVPVWIWFVYRVVRGAVQFARHRVI
jgi:uncharacterized membrane protein